VATATVSLAWYARGPSQRSTASVDYTSISATKDGSYVAASASTISTSTYKVGVFYNGKTDVYNFEATGVVQSVSIVNTPSGALLAVGGSANGLLNPAVYSVSISPQ
jgi:hypothetical protein